METHDRCFSGHGMFLSERSSRLQLISMACAELPYEDALDAWHLSQGLGFHSLWLSRVEDDEGDEGKAEDATPSGRSDPVGAFPV